MEENEGRRTAREEGEGQEELRGKEREQLKKKLENDKRDRQRKHEVMERQGKAER